MDASDVTLLAGNEGVVQLLIELQGDRQGALEDFSSTFHVEMSDGGDDMPNAITAAVMSSTTAPWKAVPEALIGCCPQPAAIDCSVDGRRVTFIALLDPRAGLSGLRGVLLRGSSIIVDQQIPLVPGASQASLHLDLPDSDLRTPGPLTAYIIPLLERSFDPPPSLWVVGRTPLRLPLLLLKPAQAWEVNMHFQEVAQQAETELRDEYGRETESGHQTEHEAGPSGRAGPSPSALAHAYKNDFASLLLDLSDLYFTDTLYSAEEYEEVLARLLNARMWDTAVGLIRHATTFGLRVLDMADEDITPARLSQYFAQCVDEQSRQPAEPAAAEHDMGGFWSVLLQAGASLVRARQLFLGLGTSNRRHEQRFLEFLAENARMLDVGIALLQALACVASMLQVVAAAGWPAAARQAPLLVMAVVRAAAALPPRHRCWRRRPSPSDLAATGDARPALPRRRLHCEMYQWRHFAMIIQSFVDCAVVSAVAWGVWGPPVVFLSTPGAAGLSFSACLVPLLQTAPLGVLLVVHGARLVAVAQLWPLGDVLLRWVPVSALTMLVTAQMNVFMWLGLKAKEERQRQDRGAWHQLAD